MVTSQQGSPLRSLPVLKALLIVDILPLTQVQTIVATSYFLLALFLPLSL